MNKLKYSPIIACVFLFASTTAFLLEAQEPRDWKNVSGVVVLKSGALEVDRTLQDAQENVPTKVYIRDSSGLKSLQFTKISESDRSYVLQELGLPEIVEEDSNERNLVVVPRDEGLQSPEKEKYAFLVAVSEYGRGISSLNGPCHDVADLKARLIELGFRAENIVVLSSDGKITDLPTKEYIEESYRQLLNCVKPGDLVFVYLSGHGLQLENSHVSYFAPVYVKLNDIPNTSVSIDEMMKQLAESPAEFRWMVVDACRNDPNKKSIFTVKASGVKGMTKLENIPNSISLLQSCQPGACSYDGGGDDHPEIQNGVFTLALLEALSDEGKADLNRDGIVSFMEICEYVTKETNVKANYYHHAEQIPTFFSGKLADFAFLEGLASGEAKKLYQEACALRRQKKYSSALEKIRSACQKDPENQVYAEMKDMLEEIVNGTISDPPASSSWTGNYEAGTRKTLTYKGVEFAFRYCPSGSYTMGSPSNEVGRYLWEQEPHKVTISEGFWICETETTQEQWDAVGAKKEKECNFKGSKLPVENVTWNESDAFIKKLNELGAAPKGWRFVLPTEEQWEYACRAGTTGSTYGVPLDEAAWYRDNSGSKTHEVGTKKPNKWGIFDMLGNVREWTSSKYNSGSSFVKRGGSWLSLAEGCRPAIRYYSGPTHWNSNLGFRAALVRR